MSSIHWELGITEVPDEAIDRIVGLIEHNVFVVISTGRIGIANPKEKAAGYHDIEEVFAQVRAKVKDDSKLQYLLGFEQAGVKGFNGFVKGDSRRKAYDQGLKELDRDLQRNIWESLHKKYPDKLDYPEYKSHGMAIHIKIEFASQEFMSSLIAEVKAMLQHDNPDLECLAAEKSVNILVKGAQKSNAITVLSIYFGISEDEVASAGDAGSPEGNDYCLAERAARFCVGDYSNPDSLQVSTVKALSLKFVKASIWLLNNLKFKETLPVLPAAGASDSPVVSEEIETPTSGTGKNLYGGQQDIQASHSRLASTYDDALGDSDPMLSTARQPIKSQEQLSGQTSQSSLPDLSANSIPTMKKPTVAITNSDLSQSESTLPNTPPSKPTSINPWNNASDDLLIASNRLSDQNTLDISGTSLPHDTAPVKSSKPTAEPTADTSASPRSEETATGLPAEPSRTLKDKIIITKENCTYANFASLMEQFGSYGKVLENVEFKNIVGDMEFNIFYAIYKKDVNELRKAVEATPMGFATLAQALNKINDYTFVSEIAAWGIGCDKTHWEIFWRFLNEKCRTVIIAKLEDVTAAREYARSVLERRGKPEIASSFALKLKSSGRASEDRSSPDKRQQARNDERALTITMR